MSIRENESKYSLEEINTIEGVRTSLSSLESFKELCEKRKNFTRKGICNLNVFVIYGRIMLDRFGYASRIFRLRNQEYDITINPDEFPDVCPIEEFQRVVSHYECDPVRFNIKPGSICPHCGEKFTIDSLKENLVTVDGCLAHQKCYLDYQHNAEVNLLIAQIINPVFGSDTLFNTLPNPSATFLKTVAHIPWFMVYTADGDIKIGRRFEKIFIEWQENYKPFDIAIFKDFPHSLKWYDHQAAHYEVEPNTAPLSNIKRFACVFSVDEAIAHLQKAHEV